jgi:hypothetical protein
MKRFFEIAPEVKTNCSSSASDSSMGTVCLGVLTPTTMALSILISFVCKVGLGLK